MSRRDEVNELIEEIKDILQYAVTNKDWLAVEEALELSYEELGIKKSKNTDDEIDEDEELKDEND